MPPFPGSNKDGPRHLPNRFEVWQRSLATPAQRILELQLATAPGTQLCNKGDTNYFTQLLLPETSPDKFLVVGWKDATALCAVADYIMTVDKSMYISHLCTTEAAKPGSGHELYKFVLELASGLGAVSVSLVPANDALYPGQG